VAASRLLAPGADNDERVRLPAASVARRSGRGPAEVDERLTLDVIGLSLLLPLLSFEWHLADATGLVSRINRADMYAGHLAARAATSITSSARR
jgi:hypothetical protein